jgi:sialic acid synthase SpsE/mannose-6-phosphate isomerase-like protein (cupin superfamily)
MSAVVLHNFNAQDPLIILDLANNHNGSVDLGKRIIDGVAEAADGLPFRVAVKFQYRDLDSFIHPDFRDRFDLKYVKRFLSTRLSWDQFAELTQHAKSLGLLTASTPFDEPSVQYVVDHGHDVLKVASASFTDWPLWEAIVGTSLPIVASTAAATFEDIDRVVTFLQHRKRDFALMHCVAAYPTADGDLLLDRIDALRERYFGVPVGYSTHEDPNNLTPVVIAVGKGCAVLERHVGVPTEDVPLNGYSSEPTLVRRWLDAALDASRMCGGSDRLSTINETEAEALRGLSRGVFVSRPIDPERRVTAGDVFYAIPLQDGQVSANEWSKYLAVNAIEPLSTNQALQWSAISSTDRNDQIVEIVDAVGAFLDESGVIYPTSVEMEISHHYGIDSYFQYGMTMITIVNREYCKKLLIMLSGQEHPEQYHKVKEETFHVLHGDVTLWLDGQKREMAPGDVVVIEPGQLHRFSTKGGAVIEEISTTHATNDSFYVDEAIMANQERKSFVRFWGRFEVD